MKNYIHLYKQVSNEILEALKYDKLENLDEYFEKRENIINDLEENESINEFKRIYKKNIYGIDNEIKVLLQEKILGVKKEIAEYKKSQNGNFTYTNMNKINFNIFSKKV
ncbi:flagellar protein FliT [Paraclostridium bifermentans]|uniref:flagellar protein FliT n=1 Tax=Paraclostridium bifermentans TaxID=1490 RepID=UPI001C801B0E|nr:flagellar protein FliT [Paraclostridium bifermentans]GIM32905.1 flagellar protein FliT [Paraclostridium bifermentans subsp. muricolitidis]